MCDTVDIPPNVYSEAQWREMLCARPRVGSGRQCGEMIRVRTPFQNRSKGPSFCGLWMADEREYLRFVVRSYDMPIAVWDAQSGRWFVLRHSSAPTPTTRQHLGIVRRAIGSLPWEEVDKEDCAAISFVGLVGWMTGRLGVARPPAIA